VDLITEQKLERRERILAAARELFAERGYEGLTMRDLAAHCRVSVPTLYNQFGGKDALLGAAALSHFEALLTRARIEGPGQGHRRVIGTIEMCAGEIARLSDYHRALLRAFMGVSETAGLQASLAGQLTAELGEALGQMRSGRQLAAWVSPGVLAERITVACIGASVAWLLGGLDDRGLRAAMLHAAASMVLAGARGAARADLEQVVQAAQDVLAEGRGASAVRA
jgi:AcrR family transcriptional regulator